jgi:ligand-binding SRPBCC domain-containing protein
MQELLEKNAQRTVAKCSEYSSNCPMAHFEYSSVIHAPREAVFKAHADIKILGQIMPDEYRIDVTGPEPSEFSKGAEFELKVTRAGVSVSWGTVIEDVVPGESFRDRQTYGPFDMWIHTHRFEEHGPNTLVTDFVEYDLPGGILGKLADDLFVRRELKRIFEIRHQKLGALLASSAEKGASR